MKSRTSAGSNLLMRHRCFLVREPRGRLAFSATICDNVLVVLTVFAYLHASRSDFGAPEADVLALGSSNRVAVEVPTQGGLAYWTDRLLPSVSDNALSAKAVATRKRHKFS